MRLTLVSLMILCALAFVPDANARGGSHHSSGSHHSGSHSSGHHSGGNHGHHSKK